MKHRSFWLCILLVISLFLAACKSTDVGGDIKTDDVMEVSMGDDLWLKIETPHLGEVFDTPQIELHGQASIDAKISINGVNLNLENSQDFSTTLNLSKGENLFEITASNTQGNKASLTLTVYYEP